MSDKDAHQRGINIRRAEKLDDSEDKRQIKGTKLEAEEKGDNGITIMLRPQIDNGHGKGLP